MINPFHVAWLALRDALDEAGLLVACNLIWSLLCLPLLWVAYALLTGDAPIPAALVLLLGVLPGGPATVALTFVAQRAIEGRAARISEFFAALRRYARRAWLALGVWSFGLLLILCDLGFALDHTTLAATIMLGLGIALLLAWLALLIYLTPQLIGDDPFDLALALRRAAFMALGHPIVTLVSLALMLLTLWGSLLLLLPIFAITPALLSVWSARLSQTLIADARRR